MLYLIGIGLSDEKDISLRGLEILKGCDEAYAEFYTNLHSGRERLEALSGKKITVLSRRELEETPAENVFKNSAEKDVALLVSGDAMVATTHSDTVLSARKKGIAVKIIHSSSVYSAVAETGLQIYKFGRTATIVYPDGNYFPTSPYDALKENATAGLHTLFLLDLRAEENRYMTVNEAIELLLRMEETKKEGFFSSETLCVGVARLGADTKIAFGKASELLKKDFGPQPHCLVVPGKMHYLEEEFLRALE